MEVWLMFEFLLGCLLVTIVLLILMFMKGAKATIASGAVFALGMVMGLWWVPLAVFGVILLFIFMGV